ncbi:hypothetical protein AKJ09_07160 [Labilithrix luteola]|uniref:Uncharacterized protein n=1 Tax=Labilithrix luteola TaxID=1391654 RepID=A0A0K1Q4B4_9BACT|nr:hypothetical protein [Labilithrix luteola]AKV00497.1 hypothetical protein AKJ09_07160 [Labilithrix luteola]
MLRRGRSRAALCALSAFIGLLGVCAPRTSAAAEDELEFTWRAPAGCPGREQVLARIRGLVGANVATSSRVEVVAEVEKKGGYALVITTNRGEDSETKTASSTSCTTIGEAAAIIVAAALVRARAAATVEDTPEPEPRPAEDAVVSTEPSSRTEPMATTRPERIVRPLPAPTPANHLGFSLGAGAILDAGTLPKPTLGAELVVAGTLGLWQAGLTGSIWAQGEQRYATETSARLVYDVVDAGLFGCFSPIGKRIVVGACTEVDATVMKIEARGIRYPGSARILWPTLRVGIMAELAVTRSLVVFGRADAAFAFAVPRVVLTTTSDNVGLHDVSVPSLRMALGVRANVL